MSDFDNLTYIRRGHGIFFRGTEIPEEDREELRSGKEIDTGKTILKYSKRYYVARLAPGYKWSNSKGHYPEPIPKYL